MINRLLKDTIHALDSMFGTASSQNSAGVKLGTYLDGLVFDLNSKIDISQIGAPNGVAELDISGKLLISQLPIDAMEYQGMWNALTNMPVVVDGVGDVGDVYRVNVAGTQDLGSGPIDFSIGDLVIYNGLVWEVSPSGGVYSVNFLTGAVTLNASDIPNDSTVTGAQVSDALDWLKNNSGGSTSTLNLTGNFNFVAESFKNLDITMGVDAASLISARLYVSTYPGSAFSEIAILKIYSNPARKDNQLLYIAEVPLICNTLSVGANIADPSITLTNAAGLVKYDLMYVMGATPEFRRISGLAGSVASAMTNIENAHSIGDGVANAVEFGNLVFLDDSGAKKIYARVEFAAVKTVSLTLDVVARG
jgi:hypothetical protein